MSWTEANAPEGFTPLGPNSSLYTPGLKPDPATSNEPALVILCSWMGAQPKHISKYTATYQRLLPRTPVLLIQSQLLDLTYRSTTTQRKNLARATKVVQSIIASLRDGGVDMPSRRIVLHVFSHGGSNSAIQLLTCLRGDLRLDRPLKLRAFILDSTPGDANFMRGIHAASVGLPRTGIARMFGLIAIYITAVYLHMIGLIEGLRKKMLDSTIFSTETGRLYLYSKADKMIYWEAVRLHAEQAEAKGYSVRQHCFESSPHCGHVMEDEEGYWQSVQNAWATPA